MAALLAGEPVGYSPEFQPLTTEQAVTVLVRAIRRIPEEVKSQEDESPLRGLILGNRLVELAATLPMPTNLPVREIYRIHSGTLRPVINDRQIAWVCSRSPAPYLIEQFTQDLPDMPPREQIDVLQMLGRAGDFQRGAPWPILGGGPDGTAPPVTPEKLIDDQTPAPRQPGQVEPDTSAATTSHPAGDDPMRSLLAELVKPGRLMFNPPDRMQLGQTERVEVRLTRTRELDARLLENLHGPGKPRVEDIDTTEWMTVTLTSEDDGLEIKSYSDKEQIVTQDETTTWEFAILACKRGQQRLVMSVSLRIPVPGQQEPKSKSIPVREETINVQVGAPALAAHFISGNWQWFVGTAIAIAALVVAVLYH